MARGAPRSDSKVRAIRSGRRKTAQFDHLRKRAQGVQIEAAHGSARHSKFCL
jgi:hypothetical protein